MDEFDKRIGCPKLYAGISAWVERKVPEGYVADVVSEIYKEASAKREQAPEQHDLMLAWLKAFGRFIVPRFMKKERREKPVDAEVVEALPQHEDETLDRVRRLRSLEPSCEGEAKAIEDAIHLEIHGGTLAERAELTGESREAVSKRWHRYSARIAALIAGGTVLLLVLAMVLAIAMRPKQPKEEMRPDEAPTAPPTEVPNPAMSTPPVPSEKPDAHALLEKAVTTCAKAPNSDVCLTALIDAQNADPSVVKDPRFKKARAPFDAPLKPPIAGDKPPL
jgi:hypothetical protein